MNESLRLTYSQDDGGVAGGIAIVGEEIRKSVPPGTASGVTGI